MSTSIRLSVVGKKNYPIYRIVVSETRYKRDGKYLAVLGIYNPNIQPPKFELKKDEFDKWVKNGAIISDGLRKLLPASPCPLRPACEASGERGKNDK